MRGGDRPGPARDKIGGDRSLAVHSRDGSAIKHIFSRRYYGTKYVFAEQFNSSVILDSRRGRSALYIHIKFWIEKSFFTMPWQSVYAFSYFKNLRRK